MDRPPGAGDTWPSSSPPLGVPWGPPAPSRAPCRCRRQQGLGQGHRRGQHHPPSPSPLWPALREPRGQTWTEGDNGSGHPTTLPPDSVAPACENSGGKGKWLLTGSGQAQARLPGLVGRGGSPARLCLPARAPACPHPIGVKGLPAPGCRWYWYLPGWRARRMGRV